MPRSLTPCAECGKPPEGRLEGTRFCSTGCRLAFNRRRRDRGTELYDVLMSARYEHNGATVKMVDALVSAYVLADKKLRAGRMSWQPWATAQYRIPQVYGPNGDGR